MALQKTWIESSIHIDLFSHFFINLLNGYISNICLLFCFKDGFEMTLVNDKTVILG